MEGWWRVEEDEEGSRIGVGNDVVGLGCGCGCAFCEDEGRSVCVAVCVGLFEGFVFEGEGEVVEDAHCDEVEAGDGLVVEEGVED